MTLVVIIFSLPAYPAAGLDPSWRMALGLFSQEGRQFGPEVAFTFGPLGFIMGGTYWGGQWASLLGWHAMLAVAFVGIVYWQGYRLTGYSRIFYFLFFFLYGLSYQDATHQIIIALAGLELIRRSNSSWQWSSGALGLLLAVLSLMKFTNLVLSLVLVLLAGSLELWSRRRASALRMPLLYLAAFLLGWMLCGQHLANLPAYLRSSWEISQGYQDVMGLSCPPLQLHLGLTVLALILGYALLNLLTSPDRRRGAVLTLGAGAFIYLNWKHGFVRADGHQVGFYYAALTVAVTSPFLLEDSPRFGRTKRLILATAGLVSLFGFEQVLPGMVSGALGYTQDKVNKTLAFALNRGNRRALYDTRLQQERDVLELLKTKVTVKQASVDVLGFEQAVAILNNFNYQPRPVFQGYCAFTPYLARLNYDYYASDRAPEFVLFKLQTLTGQLATMDDPYILRLLIQRYTYLFTDLDFTVWKRKPGPFAAADFEPKFIRSATVRPGQKLHLSDLAGQNVWVEIDYRFSLLGKLRRFFFKPPVVQLRITDELGHETTHRLPQPIGAAGFMLSPVIDDLLDFMQAAGGSPKRHASSIIIETAPQEWACLQDGIKVRFSRLPASNAGANFLKESNQSHFTMFASAPIAYRAFTPVSTDFIDKRRVVIMHAPSEMLFEVPTDATTLQGAYGFLPGAYSNGGQTKGAEFFVVWSLGNESIILHQRFLDPLNRPSDRGLQKFTVVLPDSSGRVFLRITPGPSNQTAWDWTGWTGIEFK